jgi:hypothetical protein
VNLPYRTRVSSSTGKIAIGKSDRALPNVPALKTGTTHGQRRSTFGQRVT